MAEEELGVFGEIQDNVEGEEKNINEEVANENVPDESKEASSRQDEPNVLSEDISENEEEMPDYFPEYGEMGEMDEFIPIDYEGEYDFEAELREEASVTTLPHDEDEKKRVLFLEPETVHIGGDFSKSVTYVTDKRYDKVYKFGEEEEEEEEEEEYVIEEEEEEQEEEEVIIERGPLYEKYYKLNPGYNAIKMKNNFLQKKMVEYFLKRKMDHVTKEDSNYSDNLLKYYKQLRLFNNLKIKTQKAKDELMVDINIMRDQKHNEEMILKENIEGLYKREKEIGTGLILAKTGKEIPEKLVERLIRNQAHKSKEMTSLRLLFIKIRDKIADMEAACEALDKIGENYTLMGYEQLKIERRNHTDKIEERDEELSRLRMQCSNAIQSLAHIREKLSSVQEDIFRASQEMINVEKERMEIREKVNIKKRQRDMYRGLTSKLKDEAGLLTKPKLLRDMEDTINEKENLEAELSQLKSQNAKYKFQIANIKTHIEKYRKHRTTFIKKPKETQSEITSQATKKTFQGRPSLLKIAESVCDDFI